MYDKPQRLSYTFGVEDFTSGGTLAIRGPATKRGRLEEIVVSVTTTFNAVTTPGAVQVGITGTLARNANLPMGTTAADTAIAATQTAGAIISDALEADTDILVTLVSPTGGTPAGAGHVTVMVEWY